MVNFHSQNFWKLPFLVKEIVAILYLRLWFFDCCMHVAQKIVPEEQTQAALIDLNNVFPWSSTRTPESTEHYMWLYEISRTGETAQCTLC